MTEPDVPEPSTPELPPPPRPRGGMGIGLLILLTLMGVSVFGVAAGALYWAINAEPEFDVAEGSFLEIRLKGALQEAASEAGLFDDPANLPPSFAEVVTAVRRAAEDDRIEGVLLHLDGASAGFASWEELRGALGELREQGKPCIVNAPSFLDNGTYYVASACDAIVASEAAGLLVAGLSVELTYYKTLFDEWGVVPEYEHVGDYKSFIETYERSGPSEPASEAYELLLDGLFDELVRGIAEGRGLEMDEARAWIDAPVMTPSDALERGMIDAIAYGDAVRVYAHTYGAEDWAETLAGVVTDTQMKDANKHYTSIQDYVTEQRGEESEADAKVAVIVAAGNIASGESSGGGLFGDNGMLLDGEFRDWMEEARDDDAVKAVVVRVDSRGGSGLAASNMWREVARTQQSGKPVVISFGNAAASGGYLLGAGGDYIVTQASTLTGSIGVFGGKFALGGLYERFGMTTHTYRRGRTSDLFSLTTPFSDEGRAVFRAYLTAFYDQFVSKVAEGRDMSWDEVHAVAQGRVWTGRQALERGLVDEIGGTHVAIAKAAELAELEAWGLRRIPEAKTFWETLLEDLEADATVAVDLGMPRVPEGLLQELAVLEAIGRDGGVGAWLPGNPTVQ
ncbi:MAG: signal peptide peptidase SppA [Myxococcota bacterium]